MKYKFTVIVPVYNAELWLEECVSSVLKQTIGFIENIQLILVNDGSTDSSADICNEYEKKYPDNITYIYKENGGVSSARNLGMEYIEGVYTVFLDSDDYWSTDAFDLIYSFFEAHKKTLDICVCRLQHTGDLEVGVHPLDWRFEKGNRVVSLDKEPECIQSAIGNSVFRSASIRDVRFNEKLRTAEDAFFNTQVILKRMKMGIISDAVFYYRRMDSEDSLTSDIRMRKEFYLDIPREYYLKLMKSCRNRFGWIPEYVQHLIRYDIQWRKYIPEAMEVLTSEEQRFYVDTMKQVLQNLDDDVIRKRDTLNQYRRLYLFQLKYGKDIVSQAELKENALYYKGIRIMNMRAPSFFKILELDIQNDFMRISGCIKDFAPEENKELQICCNGEKVHSVKLHYNETEYVPGYVGEHVAEGALFDVRIPISPGMKISFCLKYRNGEIPLNPSFNKDTGLDRSRKHSFIILGKYIVKYRGGKLCFYRNRLKTRIASRFRRYRENRNK